MTIQPLQDLIRQLRESQQQLINLLISVADDQDWRPEPDQWSFRFIAAHLSASEKECLQVRVWQWAIGANPHFDFYDNSQRDFSGIDLREALQDWEQTRKEIHTYLESLPEEAMMYAADHVTYGKITLMGYLKVWLEHDQEHLEDLQRSLEIYKRST
jgi:hypothetical protein